MLRSLKTYQHTNRTEGSNEGENSKILSFLILPFFAQSHLAAKLNFRRFTYYIMDMEMSHQILIRKAFS